MLYHSAPGSRVITKKKKKEPSINLTGCLATRGWKEDYFRCCCQLAVWFVLRVVTCLPRSRTYNSTLRYVRVHPPKNMSAGKIVFEKSPFAVLEWVGRSVSSLLTRTPDPRERYPALSDPRERGRDTLHCKPRISPS